MLAIVCSEKKEDNEEIGCSKATKEKRKSKEEINFLVAVFFTYLYKKFSKNFQKK